MCQWGWKQKSTLTVSLSLVITNWAVCVLGELVTKAQLKYRSTWVYTKLELFRGTFTGWEVKINSTFVLAVNSVIEINKSSNKCCVFVLLYCNTKQTNKQTLLLTFVMNKSFKTILVYLFLCFCFLASTQLWVTWKFNVFTSKRYLRVSLCVSRHTRQPLPRIYSALAACYAQVFHTRQPLLGILLCASCVLRSSVSHTTTASRNLLALTA